MKFKARSYPRPVVGNGDDVLAGFQAPIEVETKGQNFEISLQFQNGSKSLSSCIKRKEAAYVLHLECSSTFYRECFETQSESMRLSIPRTSLFGGVDGIVLVVAKKAIDRYKVDNSHADYGRRTFSIRPGDILAISDPIHFDADVSSEDLQKISSIMVICADLDKLDGELSVRWQEPKIKVIMPKLDFDRYKLACNNPISRSLAGMLVVLPVLTEAVRHAFDADSEFSDLRWWRCIRRRIEQMNIDASEDPLIVAQTILSNPISRCLAGCVENFGLGD